MDQFNQIAKQTSIDDPATYEELYESLKVMTHWATHGNKVGNPYCKEEVLIGLLAVREEYSVGLARKLQEGLVNDD